MPATFSFDRRRRVVAAVDAGEGTQERIAARFSVSLGWVEKRLRQRRRAGPIEPIGHRGGAPRRLDEQAVETVRAAITAQPDLALEDWKGPIDGDAFFVFLENFLGPSLRPGDVVLMDNLPTHKSLRMSEASLARGAEVIFLPRYSAGLQSHRGRMEQTQSVSAQSGRPHAQGTRPRVHPWSGEDHRHQRKGRVPTCGRQTNSNLTGNRKML